MDKIEKLELKHLCGYLPYGVELLIEKNNSSEIYQLSGLTVDTILLSPSKGMRKVVTINSIDRINPLLLPLSEMYNFQEIMDEFSECSLDAFDIAFYLKAENRFDFLSYSAAEMMFKNKIDIFGLIDVGLAIDKRTVHL